MELMNDKEQRSMLKLWWIYRDTEKSYYSVLDDYQKALKNYNDACKANMNGATRQYLAKKMNDLGEDKLALLKKCKALASRIDAEMQRYYNKAKQINDDKGYKISYDSTSGTPLVQ